MYPSTRHGDHIQPLFRINNGIQRGPPIYLFIHHASLFGLWLDRNNGLFGAETVLSRQQRCRNNKTTSTTFLVFFILRCSWERL